MKTSRGILILIVAGLMAAVLPAQESDRSRLAFYQSAYEELSPDEDARAARAHEIFALILKVAGTRPGLAPKLFVAKNSSPPPPAAIAIRDGGIIISERMLDVCYGEPGQGDDRLAFILAHEIAHQIKNDFWGELHFTAVDLSHKNDPADAEALERIKRELALDNEEIARARQRLELEADEMGIIFAAMAGFDCRAVVMEDDKVNLFRYVEASMDPANIQGVSRDDNHPAPEERAAWVKVRLAKVLDALVLFDAGLVLYRSGHYERAAAIFAEFIREYPGREVYHNLATCHHQMAQQLLWEWKGDQRFPFKLSLPAEAETRARKIVLRGPPATGAAAAGVERRFKEEIGKAVESYRSALAQDPGFWPSANNLGCALLLLDNPYEAVGLLEGARHSVPGSALVLNNLGVAYHVIGSGQKAEEIFQAALKADPAYDAPLFNLGLIALLDNDRSEAKKDWDAYLLMDQDSVWAREIRRKLGYGEVSPPAAARSDGAPEDIAGMTTASYDDEIPAALAKHVTEKHLPGDLDIKEFANGVIVIFQSGQVLCLSASPPFKGKTAAGLSLGASAKDLAGQYGRPAFTLPSSLGEAWVYPAKGITFVLQEGKVISWILFRRA